MHGLDLLSQIVFVFQIGNAVPPPMAKAIGLEVKKSLVATQKKHERLASDAESIIYN